MKRPWPSCLRGLAGDHARFTATYFAMFPGYYFSGDGCRRDTGGYYWIIGRVDDVINVSGHRIGACDALAADGCQWLQALQGACSGMSLLCLLSAL